MSVDSSPARRAWRRPQRFEALVPSIHFLKIRILKSAWLNNRRIMSIAIR
jgi:hypothetical protein